MKKRNKIQTHNQTSTRTYRFDFGTDGKLYTVSFKGILSTLEIRGILEACRNNLYKNCRSPIQAYLDSHGLKYSDLTFHASLLEHGTAMAFADSLLHGSTCEALDNWIGDTDEYHASMDHQWQTGTNCYEGCYLAVSRIPSLQDGCYGYHIIGQAFQDDGSNGRQHSYFAIRQNKAGGCLHTLDGEDGCPVLATFGCVDVMALLLNIVSTTTKGQAAALANK